MKPSERYGKCFGSVVARVAPQKINKIDIYEAQIEDYREALLYIDEDNFFDIIVYWIGLDRVDDLCYIAYNIDELEFLEETKGLDKLRKEITIRNVIK
jgi:hypothetical protein